MDRPTERAAQDLLRVTNWHAASCRWERKGAENVHQGTKLLFCLYSLIGTWEQQCLGQTWTELQPKLCPWALGQGRRGSGTPAAATGLCWGTGDDAPVSFSGFTAPWKPKMRALCRGKKLHPCDAAQLHPPPGRTLPPCLSTEREETPTRLLYFSWLLLPLETSLRKEDIATVFPGLAAHPSCKSWKSWSSASHH